MKHVYCPNCRKRLFDSSRCITLAPLIGDFPKSAFMSIKCTRCPIVYVGTFSDII